MQFPFECLRVLESKNAGCEEPCPRPWFALQQPKLELAPDRRILGRVASIGFVQQTRSGSFVGCPERQSDQQLDRRGFGVLAFWPQFVS